MPAESLVLAAINMAWEEPSSMAISQAPTQPRNLGISWDHMTSQTEKMRGHTMCAVDVSPEVVDAGAEMTLEAKVSCSPPCDLRGHALLVKHAGADPRRVELTEFDGVTNRTGEFIMKAPVKPGEYAWLALSPAVVKEGVSYIQASAPISFTVKPHTTLVVTWDAPSAVVIGERFRLKVGIKCSNQCDFTNREFGIYDHTGAQVGRSALSGDRWPGTTGLYVAEVELQAPAREGLYTWSVRSAGSDAGIPHTEGYISFGGQVFSHPEWRMTVEAVDKDSQTPLSGARVVMHPYKAITDEHGVAAVPGGKRTYKLFVSQNHHITFRVPLAAAADMKNRTGVELEPVPDRH